MKLDETMKERLEKGRANHQKWLPGWAECLAFYEGRQFVYRSQTYSGWTVNELPTAEGGTKPQHRARTVRNFIQKFVVAEVSMGTQRTPGYEVTPTTTDPEDVQAAKLAEKVLLYQYEFLNLRKHLVDAYTYAVCTGEGFLRPFWNPEAGDSLGDEGDGELYTGELQVETLGPQEVFWEPGTRFEESSWHAVEKARTMEQIRQIPGFNNADLKPDARGHGSFLQGQLNRGQSKADMVVVTEYLELPWKRHREGRRFYVANNQQITPTENYPCLVRGSGGFEPCLHKLPFIPTPHRDRDMGIVEHGIDPQRTVNDSVNKAIQWKNLALVPQILAPVGSLRDRPTDEPGSVIKYVPVAGMKPEFQNVPPIPSSLFEMTNQALSHMEEIFSNRSIPAQVESGKGIAAFTERDQSVRGFIVQALSDFHSRLGRHLLHHVQRWYTEPRLLMINGKHGAEYIPNFKGANLRDQVNVTVRPGSIEPRTRAGVEAKVFALVDRQLIAREKALEALEGGFADGLLDDIADDQAKQQREIQQIIALGDLALAGGEAPDADDFDRHDVHLDELHRFMKTHEFELLPSAVQEVFRLHEQQHKMFVQQEQMEQAAQQVQQAEQLGMANATRPTSKPMPSAPGMNGASQQPIPS